MADNFYSKYSANEPPTVVTSLNGLNGAVTLVAGSNITLTPSGNSITISSSGGGTSANTSLSNLASTAINTDFVFAQTSAIKTSNDTAVTNDLNMSSGHSSAAYSGVVTVFTGNSFNSVSGEVDIYTGNDTGSGQSGAVYIFSGDAPGGTGSLNLLTGSGAGGSGGVLFQTGSASGVSGSGAFVMQTGQVTDGVSGNILLTIGVPSGTGTRGEIQFVNGSEGTAGQVWTSTDSSGSGAWAPASGGGGSIQSATIQFLTGQNFDGGVFANPFAFTSAAALPGSTAGMVTTANQLTAVNTGPHLINFTSTSTGFTGAEWAQIAYSVNGGAQLTIDYGDNGNATGSARVVTNASIIYNFTAGDYVQFWSNGNTNWIAYQISLTDLTPR